VKVVEGTVQVQSMARVVLEAPLIQHGKAAMHPAVFGDKLLQYLAQIVTMLNTHMHPGETAAGFPVSPAPPIAQLPPPTPDLLSLKVMVE
jgi:hypothetical protein